MTEDTGKRHVTCPCGEHIEGSTEDELVEKVQAHLAAEHPTLSYTREQILMVAS
jgi:hypothetical protein